MEKKSHFGQKRSRSSAGRMEHLKASGKLGKIGGEDTGRVVRIEYYDKLVNSERKVDYFARIINKIRLRKMHKPFIILSMLNLMPKLKNPVFLLNATLNKLRLAKLRKAMRELVREAERKKRVAQKWGELAKKLIQKKNWRFMKGEEKRVEQETRVKRRKQITKRTLRYLGTVINKIIREKKKNVMSVMMMRMAQQNRPKGDRKEHRLGIQGNQGFVIQKRVRRREPMHMQNRPSSTSSFDVINVNKKMVPKSKNNGRYENKDSGMREINADEKSNYPSPNEEELRKLGEKGKSNRVSIGKNEKDSSPDRNLKEQPQKTKEVALSFGKNKGMNMLIKKRTNNPEQPEKLDKPENVTSNRGSRDNIVQGKPSQAGSNNHIYSRRNTSPSEGSLPVKNVFSRKTIGEKRGDILSKMTKEIMEINEKIMREERDPKQELTLAERIEMLNRLTTLMDLLKKYYEAQRRKGPHHEDRMQKNKFEQVLVLVKRSMETLLNKMSNDLKTSQMKNSQKRIPGEGIFELNDNDPDMNENDYRSHMQIEQMTRQLTQDLHNLIPPTYEFETLGNTQHGSIYDPRDREFQSISAINNLLQDVVQNLNNINENIYEDTFGDQGASQGNSIIKNSMPMSHSDQRTDGSKYGDYIEQSHRGGLYGKGFMRRRNNSKFTNESDQRNPSLKANYDPAFPMALNDSKGISVDMLNFLGILNFKVKKYNKKVVEKSFDLLFQKAVTDELFDRLRNLAFELKKEQFFFALAKMGIETNRRANIKSQTVYRLSKTLFLKKRWCLNFLRGRVPVDVPLNYNRANITDVNNYFGKRDLLTLRKDISA